MRLGITRYLGRNPNASLDYEIFGDISMCVAVSFE